jgi:hypothetical protein
MKQRKNMQDIRGAETKLRKPWIKPVVQKIKAGDAEVGTRSTSDGAFTTS